MGGVPLALNGASCSPTLTCSPNEPRIEHGRPQPLLLPEPGLPLARPARPEQPDRLRPLRRRRAAPPALLPRLPIPLLPPPGHPPVQLPLTARPAPARP